MSKKWLASEATTSLQAERFPKTSNKVYRKLKVYYNTLDCLSHKPWLLLSSSLQATRPSGIWFENTVNVLEYMIHRHSSYCLPEKLESEFILVCFDFLGIARTTKEKVITLSFAHG